VLFLAAFFVVFIAGASFVIVRHMGTQLKRQAVQDLETVEGLLYFNSGQQLRFNRGVSQPSGIEISSEIDCSKFSPWTEQFSTVTTGSACERLAARHLREKELEDIAERSIRDVGRNGRDTRESPAFVRWPHNSNSVGL